MLNIHIIVIQFPDAQKFKFTIQCFAQHQFSGECSAFGVWDGSCDLASKLNYVTGDELEIDVSIELFRNQTILRWCRFLCGYSSYASILIW